MLLTDATKLYLGGQSLDRVYLGTTEMWPPAVGEWTPASLPGLAIWFDASQLALADGAAVDPWPNLASGGASAAMVGSPAPTVRANAVEGLPVVRFTASAGRLRMPAGTSGVSDTFTLAYVAHMVGPTAGRVVGGIYSPWNITYGFWNGGQDVAYDGGGFMVPNTQTPWTADWKLYSADEAAGSARLFSAGVLLGAAAGYAQGFGGSFAISGFAADTPDETCDCEVAEVIVYDRKLSDTDRQAVESYLHDKWFVAHTPVPKQVPGLLWWTDPSQLALADGANINSLPDLSGNGHAATPMFGTPPTYETNAAGSLGAIDFTGTGQPTQAMTVAGLGAALTGSSAFSVFAAVRPADFTDDPIIICAPTTSDWQWILEFDAAGGIYSGCAINCYTNWTANVPLNEWSVITWVHDGTDHIWVDGAPITTVGYLGPDGASLPTVPDLGPDALLGGYWSNQYGVLGDLGEMLVYDQALVDADREQLQTYLLSKWGS